MAKNHCCSKINNKSYLVASLIVFLVLVVTDFIIHGVVMKGMYEATASLWRTEPEMQSLFPFMILGQAIVAFTFTRLFAHGHQGKGIPEGICFGIMMSVFSSGHHLIMYSVTPWTLQLVGAWAVLCLIQSAALGATAAAFYKAK